MNYLGNILVKSAIGGTAAYGATALFTKENPLTAASWVVAATVIGQLWGKICEYALRETIPEAQGMIEDPSVERKVVAEVIRPGSHYYTERLILFIGGAGVLFAIYGLTPKLVGYKAPLAHRVVLLAVTSFPASFVARKIFPPATLPPAPS